MAEVPLVTPYELRHTASTHEADAGWSRFEIADWAGAGTSEQMISSRHVIAAASFSPPTG